MTLELGSVVNYIAGSGFIVTVAGLIHWGTKVNRGLSNTVKATELLAERLNGHEKLGDERHVAMRESIARVERIALASKDDA